MSSGRTLDLIPKGERQVVVTYLQSSCPILPTAGQFQTCLHMTFGEILMSTSGGCHCPGKAASVQKRVHQFLVIIGSIHEHCYSRFV